MVMSEKLETFFLDSIVNFSDPLILFLLEKKYRSWQGSYKTFDDIIKSDFKNNWVIAKVFKIKNDIVSISRVTITIQSVCTCFSNILLRDIDETTVLDLRKTLLLQEHFERNRASYEEITRGNPY